MSAKFNQPSRRPQKKVVDNRTKFDKWLDAQVEKKQPLVVKFFEPPMPEVAGILPRKTTFILMPVMVDRYFFFAEMMTGEELWFQKANILSVGLSEEMTGDNESEFFPGTREDE